MIGHLTFQLDATSNSVHHRVAIGAAFRLVFLCLCSSRLLSLPTFHLLLTWPSQLWPRGRESLAAPSYGHNFAWHREEQASATGSEGGQPMWECWSKNMEKTWKLQKSSTPYYGATTLQSVRALHTRPVLVASKSIDLGLRCCLVEIGGKQGVWNEI